MNNCLFLFLKNISEFSHKAGTYVLIPIMVILITVDVVMRYAFNSPIVWSQEVTGILLFILLFSCQAHCWDKGHHIRMDVFYNLFPPAIKKISMVMTGFAGITFFGLMAIQGVRDIPYMMSVNDTTDELRIVLWPFRVVMVYCCFLIISLLVMYLFRSQSPGQNAEEASQ